MLLLCRMDDDDSCVMKYIEIVPRKTFDSSDVTDVKCEPLSVKVTVVFCLFGLFFYFQF